MGSRSNFPSLIRAMSGWRSRLRKRAVSPRAQRSPRSRPCWRMPGRREVLVLGGVGVAAALAGALLGPMALQIGSGASDLLSASFPDAAGRPQRLNQWLGKPLVLNFSATW